MPSHYAAYIKERWGKEVLEDERGFVSFCPVHDGMLIEDIYVIPELRSTGLAQAFATSVAEIAKSRGLKKLFGTVAVKAAYSEANLKIYLKYGFKITSCSEDVIYLKKDI